MPLKLVVDNLDDVTESLREEYEPTDDGKFKLKVDGVEDVSGLKSALQKERENARFAKTQLKQYAGLSRTAEELAIIIEEAEKSDLEKKKKEGNYEALLQQHKDKWELEKQALQEERDVALSSERKAVVSTQLMGALGKLGATEEGLDLLPDRLAARINYDIEDGKRVIKIVKADGKTPMAGDGDGGTANFEDLVKEAQTKWPSLFKASGSSGSGTQPTKGAGGAPLKRSSMSAKDVSDYVRKHGQDAYLKLPK